MMMAAVAHVWATWHDQFRIAKTGRKIMRRMINRVLAKVFDSWAKAVRADKSARVDARLKLAQVELNAKQMAMHTEAVKHSEIQDRIASMLMRHRASSELMLRFRISFKQWQLQWLSGRLAAVSSQATCRCL